METSFWGGENLLASRHLSTWPGALLVALDEGVSLVSQPRHLRCDGHHQHQRELKTLCLLKIDQSWLMETFFGGGEDTLAHIAHHRHHRPLPMH